MSELRARAMAAEAGVGGDAETELALAQLAGELAVADQTLRGAAAYPLVLALTVLGCGSIVVTVGLPALTLLPGGHAAPTWPVAAALGGAVVLLVLLAAAVAQRLPVPGLALGRQRLDGFALVSATRTLVAGGAELPRALRASAGWCTNPVVAEQLARALEAGGSTGTAAPLLSPFETALLLSGAREGVAGPTLHALADARSLALPRDLHRAVARVELTGLVLAGAALAVLGGAWMWASTSAVAL